MPYTPYLSTQRFQWKFCLNKIKSKFLNSQALIFNLNIVIHNEAGAANSSLLSQTGTCPATPKSPSCPARTPPHIQLYGKCRGVVTSEVKV